MIVLVLSITAAVQGYVADTRPVHLSAKRRDSIATQCHVPRSWMRLGTKGRLHLYPPLSASYQALDCILRKTLPKDRRKSGLVGFEIP